MMDEQKIVELTKSSADEYYLKAFKEIESGKKVVWNWSAFFGTIHWMMYRKMYIPTLLFSIIILLFFFTGNIVAFLAGIILLMSCSGALGNFMYYFYGKRRILAKYQASTKYKPVCLPMVFFQIWFVYPTVIGAIAAAAEHSTWIDQNTALFDSTKELVEAGALLHPNEFKIFTASILLMLLVLLIQYFVFPLCFWIRDKYIVNKAINEHKDKINTSFSEDNIRAVTSTKVEMYYSKQFKKIESGKIFSVNFASLFFGMFCGMFWFAYKKMYKIAAILFAIFCAYEFILINFSNGTIAIIISIIFHTANLVFMLGAANHLYYRHIKSLEVK